MYISYYIHFFSEFMLSDTSFTIFIDTVIISRISLRKTILLGYITAVSTALPFAEQNNPTSVSVDLYSGIMSMHISMHMLLNV